MSKYTKCLILVFGVILLCLGFFLWGQYSVDIPEPDVKIVVDTISIERPVPVEKVVTSTKLIPVKGDTVYNESVSILTVHDTTYVALQYQQNHYRDSLYEAWVSGVDPTLDSIKVYKTTKIVSLKEPVRHKLNILLSGNYIYKCPKQEGVFFTGLEWQTPCGLAIQGGGFATTAKDNGLFVGVSYRFNILGKK